MNFSTSATVTADITSSGVQAYSVTLPFTDTYTIQASLQLPNIDPSMSAYGSGGGAGTGTGGGPRLNSQVVAIVKQNGSTIYTSHAGDKGLITGVAASAGDVITITLSSALAQDQQLNAAQMTVSVFEGAEE